MQLALGASTAGLRRITDAFILPTAALLLVTGLVVVGIGALCVNLFQASTRTGSATLVIALPGVGIAMDSLPHRLAGTAAANSALGPAVFGVVLTHRALDALPGHLVQSGLSAADHGAGAFLLLKSPDAAGEAQAACGAGFTDASHTCALVSGVGMLVAAAVALVMTGVHRRADALTWTRAWCVAAAGTRR